jgi:hypothetical protein
MFRLRFATLALLGIAACGGTTTTTDMGGTNNDSGSGTVDMTGPADMTFVPPTLDVSTCTTATVTLTTIYTNIIMPTCATASCHAVGATPPNFAGGKTTFFTNTVGVSANRSTVPNLKYIVANDPNNSFLLYKVTGQQTKIANGGSPMPLGGSLTAAQQCQIINWVRGGALNN